MQGFFLKRTAKLKVEVYSKMLEIKFSKTHQIKVWKSYKMYIKRAKNDN